MKAFKNNQRNKTFRNMGTAGNPGIVNRTLHSALNTINNIISRSIDNTISFKKSKNKTSKPKIKSFPRMGVTPNNTYQKAVKYRKENVYFEFSDLINLSSQGEILFDSTTSEEYTLGGGIYGSEQMRALQPVMFAYRVKGVKLNFNTNVALPMKYNNTNGIITKAVLPPILGQVVGAPNFADPIPNIFQNEPTFFFDPNKNKHFSVAINFKDEKLIPLAQWKWVSPNQDWVPSNFKPILYLRVDNNQTLTQFGSTIPICGVTFQYKIQIMRMDKRIEDSSEFSIAQKRKVFSKDFNVIKEEKEEDKTKDKTDRSKSEDKKRYTIITLNKKQKQQKNLEEDLKMRSELAKYNKLAIEAKEEKDLEEDDSGESYFV